MEDHSNHYSIYEKIKMESLEFYSMEMTLWHPRMLEREYSGDIIYFLLISEEAEESNEGKSEKCVTKSVGGSSVAEIPCAAKSFHVVNVIAWRILLTSTFVLLT